MSEPSGAPESPQPTEGSRGGDLPIGGACQRRAARNRGLAPARAPALSFAGELRIQGDLAEHRAVGCGAGNDDRPIGGDGDVAVAVYESGGAIVQANVRGKAAIATPWMRN
ncbi:MAG: hypothetical protein IPG50_32405 [Myxococcales bacterium]|nr:hypothetical protein [Myxococcales bacterium]